MGQLYKAAKSIQQIKPDKWLFFFIHASVWLMLFLAFYFFSFRQNESLPTFIILQYLYGFFIFYLNFFFLTPRYLLPKKYLAFTSAILILILFSFLVIDPVIYKFSMPDMLRNIPPRFDHMPPPGNLPNRMHGGERFFVSKRLLGMFFLLFAFLTFSSAVKIFQKLMLEEDLSKRYQHEKLNAELLLLRQQINPHFLFNSLNNIHSLANRKSDLTSEAIMKLSAILRYMLSENLTNEIPISREIILIENYIDLQKLWMKNTINVDFVVENIQENYCIEPFILNPLVENAFKYGSFPGKESTIIIHLQMIGEWLHVKISNPVLLEKLSEVSSMGIGVNNVIRRLELCYPGNYKIENARKGNNYQVNLSLKLKKNELYSNR